VSLLTRRSWLKKQLLAEVDGGLSGPPLVQSRKTLYEPPHGAWDGPIRSLARVGRGPRLFFRNSTYFDWLAACSGGGLGGKDLLWPRWDKPVKVGLNIAAVVYDCEEPCVLVGLRSNKLVEYPARWHVLPSGTVADGGLCETARVEAQEEVGVELGPVYYTGLFLRQDKPLAEVTGYTVLSGDKKEILEAARKSQSGEHLDVHYMYVSGKLKWDGPAQTMMSRDSWVPAGVEAISLAKRALGV